MRIIFDLLTILLPALTLAGCAFMPGSSYPAAKGRQGMVVSVSAPATEVGLSILKQGGNAVDAAVATAFTLAVTYPPAGNIGGGGFMLVHPAPGRGEPVSFVYRETAPAAATPTMFAQGESQFTRKAVATPGTLRGLELAHHRFGTMPWAQLIAPAVKLARDGFKIDHNLATSLNDILTSATGVAEFQRVFGRPGGGRWKPGDVLRQPDLATTLQIIADQGPDAFYTGPIAREILAEMGRGKGLITARDLAEYKAIESKPLMMRYRGLYDIYVPPPPSSGGVCLLETLHMLDAFDLRPWGRWSPETMHVMAEAMRRASYDRARFLGDPAFVPIPDKLTTAQYGQQLAMTIDMHKATRSRDLAADIPLPPEEGNTTHFSIIDQNGMAVANTYTLERLWGSRVVVKGMGFLLNNNMWGFNLFPGVTDTGGTIGTPANTIAPGKRPLSSMTPTIVAQGGRVRIVTGSPGTRAIPNTIACILVSLLDFDLPVREAVKAPRFSHEWFPDQISFEAPERYPGTVKALKALGHKVIHTAPIPFQGDAHTLWVSPSGDYIGMADRRRSVDASAKGY